MASKETKKLGTWGALAIVALALFWPGESPVWIFIRTGVLLVAFLFPIQRLPITMWLNSDDPYDRDEDEKNESPD